MGYRFYLSEISYPEKVKRGDEIEISFVIENKGVAPIYNRLPFRFVLTNGTDSFELATEIDICKWMPGENREKVKLGMPEEIEEGNYHIFCMIGGGEYPIVKLATETENDGEKYYMADMEVI